MLTQYKIAVVVFLLRTIPDLRGRNGRQEVFLPKKRVRYGQGGQNGPGGKVQPGESLSDCCYNEVLEETGMEIWILGLQCIGKLTTEVENEPKSEHNFIVYFFTTEHWHGVPQKSEEMDPENAWFYVLDLPLSQMFQNFRFWLPIYFRDGIPLEVYVLENNKHEMVVAPRVRPLGLWEGPNHVPIRLPLGKMAPRRGSRIILPPTDIQLPFEWAQAGQQ